MGRDTTAICGALQSRIKSVCRGAEEVKKVGFEIEVGFYSTEGSTFDVQG